jgi:hypothetical protein
MVQISPFINGLDHVGISCFVSSHDSTFDSFESRVSEILISRHVSSLKIDGLNDFRKINGCDPFMNSHFTNPHNSAL